MRALPVAAAAAVLFAAAPRSLTAADDATRGYNAVRPSIVKVWSFSAPQRPVHAASGFVVASSGSATYIVTTADVLKDGKLYTVDVDANRHDRAATVVSTSPTYDLALLKIDVGNVKPVTFRAPGSAVQEGNTVAVAGYVTHRDENFTNRFSSFKTELRYPGTLGGISPDNRELEVDNVGIEDGLNGGPVFDASSGEVLGVVQTTSGTAPGGFAIGAPAVVLPFLARQQVTPVVSTAVAPVGTAPAPLDTPDPSDVASFDGKGGKAVIAVPFDLPGTRDVQTRYATNLLVKSLHAHGLDVVVLPPTDHFFALDRASDLCRLNGATGMFMGSFTYVQTEGESAAGQLAGGVARQFLGNFGGSMVEKGLRGSGATKETPTRIDMQIDFVGCDSTPLWDGHIVQTVIGRGNNVASAIAAGVQKTVAIAIDEYQTAVDSGQIGKPEVYRRQQMDAAPAPGATAAAKKLPFGF